MSFIKTLFEFGKDLATAFEESEQQEQVGMKVNRHEPREVKAPQLQEETFDRTPRRQEPRLSERIKANIKRVNAERADEARANADKIPPAHRCPLCGGMGGYLLNDGVFESCKNTECQEGYVEVQKPANAILYKCSGCGAPTLGSEICPKCQMQAAQEHKQMELEHMAREKELARNHEKEMLTRKANHQSRLQSQKARDQEWAIKQQAKMKVIK